MQPPKRNSTPYRVRDPEGIALLRDPRGWRLFTPFTEAECSIGEAATQVGVPLRKMYEFVQKGLRSGLLTCTRSQARKGRPIRFYRAVATEFFVAFEDVPALDLREDLIEGQRRWEPVVSAATTRHLEEVFERAEAKGSGPWGRLYGPEASGRFSQLTLASEKGFTKEAEVWRAEDVTPFAVGMGVLKLSRAQVRAFHGWLDTLNEDIFGEEGNERYFIELTLVKLPDD